MPRDVFVNSDDEPPSGCPALEVDEPPNEAVARLTASVHATADPGFKLSVPDLPPLIEETPSNVISIFRSPRAWTSWRWQMRHRIRTVEELKKAFPQFQTDFGVADAAGRFPMAITPYYASLIQRFDETDPIFRMAVPQPGELLDPPFLTDDPLAEDHDMPVPGMVHRYTDRALVIATSVCAMYCRHCTRKRVAGHRESSISSLRLKQVTQYLYEHPEIHDVIVSGGDPFTMGTETLEKVLAAIRAVPSVEIIRIGSRTPVTLPMRITDNLVTMLRRYAPVWVNTHFNHPSEITTESREACGRLVDAGIPVNNQSVLLRGVNDDPLVMETLLRGLIRMRVRPYYLFQCDLVRGVEHFRTPVSRGIEIMEYLRGRLGGLAIPSYVVDAPGGGGKIPVLPTYLVSMSPTHTVFRNFEGMLVSYPEPFAGRHGGDSRMGSTPTSPTVYDLVRGDALAIEPRRSARLGRRRKTATCNS